MEEKKWGDCGRGEVGAAMARKKLWEERQGKKRSRGGKGDKEGKVEGRGRKGKGIGEEKGRRTVRAVILAGV